MLFGDVNENGKLDTEDATLIYSISAGDVTACKYTDEWAWFYYSILGEISGDENCDSGDGSVIEYYLAHKDNPQVQVSILECIRPYFGMYWYEDILNAYHDDIIW